jgi:hypothetical protein
MLLLVPPSLVSPTATWASVVRGSVEEPACFKPQPAVSTADFSALYEQCLASGLKARMVFNQAAGIQVITVTCSLPTSATAAIVVRCCRRRRRRQRCGSAATTVGNSTDGAPPHIYSSLSGCPSSRRCSHTIFTRSHNTACQKDSEAAQRGGVVAGCGWGGRSPPLSSVLHGLSTTAFAVFSFPL